MCQLQTMPRLLSALSPGWGFESKLPTSLVLGLRIWAYKLMVLPILLKHHLFSLAWDLKANDHTWFGCLHGAQIAGMGLMCTGRVVKRRR